MKIKNTFFTFKTMYYLMIFKTTRKSELWGFVISSSLLAFWKRTWIFFKNSWDTQVCKLLTWSLRWTIFENIETYMIQYIGMNGMSKWERGEREGLSVYLLAWTTYMRNWQERERERDILKLDADERLRTKKKKKKRERTKKKEERETDS